MLYVSSLGSNLTGLFLPIFVRRWRVQCRGSCRVTNELYDSDDNEELLELEALFYACGFGGIESLIVHACLFSYIDFVTNVTSDVA